MTRIRLLPYKLSSQSSKILARELNVPRLCLEERGQFATFIPRACDTIINWGTPYGKLPQRFKNAASQWVNNPHSVSKSSNKIDTLETLRSYDIPCPSFTTNYNEALDWYHNGDIIIARTLIKSHSGRGIVVCDIEHRHEQEFVFPTAPLYTKYIKKKYEYRVHAFSNGACSVIQKRRRRSVPDSEVNWMIRSYNNGFIFAQDLVHKPHDIEELCANALEALDLDFAAFDVVYNGHLDKSFIIESNTSPGLQGRTIDFYKDNLLNLIQERRLRP